MRPWEHHRVYRCLEKRLVPYVLLKEALCGMGLAALLALTRACHFGWALLACATVSAALAIWRHADGGRRDYASIWLRSKRRGPRYYNACAVWVDPARQKPWREIGAP